MVTSKTVDGVLMYLCTVETNVEGYVAGAGMDDNGDTWLIADELSALVPDATKLVDGHLVLDDAKLAEMAKPVPTTEQQMIASLTLEIAQLKAGGAS